MLLSATPSSSPCPVIPLAQPKGYPILGHALHYRFDPLGFYGHCAQYGDLVRLRFGPRPVYFLNHPTLIKTVFVTQGAHFLARAEGREMRCFAPLLGQGLAVSDGPVWQRQRRLVQPGFQRHHLATYGEYAVAHMGAELATWRPGTVMDMGAVMTRVNRRIVTQIAFGSAGLAHADTVDQALGAALTAYHRDRYGGGYLLPRAFSTPSQRHYRAAVAALDAWIFKAIALERRHTPDSGSMLSVLLTATDDQGLGLTDRELRDELVNVLVGHDSLPHLFCWAWWEIAQRPEVEARLVAEWRQVLGGRSATLADLPRLPYTEWTVKETLRLYPLAWVTGRVVTQDCDLAGQPLHRGENVVMCQWVTHRDPRFFDNPHRFHPYRWAPEATPPIPAYAYYPFGGGPRACIGQGLTMLEAVLLLAEVGQRFHLRPLVRQCPVPQPGPSFSLRPRGGFRAEVVPR